VINLAQAASLWVKLGLSSSEFDKTLKKVENDLNRFGNRLSSLGSKMIQGFSIPFGLASGAAIKLGADLEQTKISFEVMTGSADKAAKMVSDFQKMAAKTPFETRDLFENAKTLMLYGVEADNVQGILKMLGDVSGGNVEKFNNLTYAFAQIQLAGRLTGQDLWQLVNAGFNPLQIISQQTGKSMLELKSDMEDGAISAGMVTKAFYDATSEGGRFFGMMDRQSQTTAGRFSTLKDNAIIAFINLGTALLPIANKIIDSLTPITQKLNEMAVWFSKLSPAAQNTIISFVGFATALGPVTFAIGKVISGFSALIGFARMLPLGVIASGISGITYTLQVAFGASNSLGESFKFLGQSMGSSLSKIAVLFNPVILSIVGITVLAFGFYSAWKQNLWGFQDLISNAWETVKSWANAVGSAIQPVADFFKDAWKFAIDSLTFWLKDLINTFYRVFQAAKNIIGFFKGEIGFKQIFSEGMDFDFAGMLFDKIRDGAKTVFETVSGGIVTFATTLGDGVGQILGAMKTTWGEIWQSIFPSAESGTITGGSPNANNGAFIPGEMVEQDVKMSNQNVFTHERALFEYFDELGQKAKELAQKFAEARKEFFQSLGNQLLSKAPIASSVVQGATQGAAFGPMGALFGALVPLIASSKTFQTLMDNINPLLQTFADAVGMLLQPLLPLVTVIATILNPIFTALGTILTALTPIFELLFPVFKILGQVVLGVAWGLAEGVNTVFKAINWALGWLGVQLDLIDTTGFASAMETLSELTWDQAMASANAADAMNDLTESILNAPQGFKVAAYRFNAIDIPAMATGGTVKASPGGTIVRLGEGGEDEDVIPASKRGGGTVNNYITVISHDAEDTYRKIKGFMERDNVRSTGLFVNSAPQFVGR
jgi:tape measure domain-containing protein